MRRHWEDLTSLYDRHPRWGAALAGAAVLVVLSGIHAALSFTPALVPLYVIPIWLATRMGGRVSGLVLVVLCTLVGIATEWQIGHTVSESIEANLLFRFAALTLLMMLIWKVERALEKHQHMALTDPLTGLLNRHALREFAAQALNRALLRQQPTTVVMIDCDGLKLLNDTHGHRAGDLVLRLLARALERHSRQTDLVARIGGDEFAVVFQNTDLEEARQIMTRIDEAFTFSAMDAGYVAGLSIGYGSTRDGCNELDAVLEIADASMYRHKQQKKTGAFLN